MDIGQSHSLRALRRAHERATQALRRSTVGSVLGLAKRSPLYRWLTSDPEPDIIVIDLRDAYTVGPLLSVVNRVRRVTVREWDNSRLEPVADAVGEQLATSHVVRLLSSVVEPPEPPADERR